jgi:hypothetical protein
MTIRIFYFEGSGGGSEQWLELEDDGTLNYSTSPNYYADKAGAKPEYRRLSVAEAKKEWPAFAGDIDQALVRLSEAKKSN